MFLLGIFLTVGWIFCFFYYPNEIPRNANVALMFSGLFSMGYGLLRGKN